MQTLRNLIAYLKRHPGYIVHLFCDISKLLWYKCTGKKILVITTGSGGIGDYLWIRSYYPLIHQKGYKIILIAMAHWCEIVESFDSDDIDITRYFESCLSPKKLETSFFKIFTADVYLNFRQKSIADFVKYKTTYNDNWLDNDNMFYEEKNNGTISRFLKLPEQFKHHLPIITPSSTTTLLLKHPYVIVVEGGNTQGKMTDAQLYAIISHLYTSGYYILFNGDSQRIKRIIDVQHRKMIINGSVFSFPQYTYLVKHASFVVTVNTSIYHFAVQLKKPRVVISCNEYSTLQLYDEQQIIVFNTKLQNAFENDSLPDYIVDSSISLADIEIDRIITAIDNVRK